MPSLPSTSNTQMSTMTWTEAASRVAGAVIGARQPDSLNAAQDALQETLQDWDSRRDWRYTQLVAPDVTLNAATNFFDLPSLFKKPYVAYLNVYKVPLLYIERGNWHRVFPGDTTTTVPKYYSVFNESSSGQADVFPPPAANDLLTVLYYRNITYFNNGNQLVDIPQRWEGYILDGARARLTLGKNSQKADKYFALYEAGVKKAKEDDLRIPDQFLTFQPADQFNMPPYWNPNSTWESTWDW